MSIVSRISRWRDWFPVPSPDEGFNLVRWVLLEADRRAVTGSLLTLVFVTFTMVATVWTFEMQKLMTETGTVQTILNTFLSGMILLVSIVVSINSIALSHDITSVEDQEARIEGAIAFRRELGKLTESGENPSDPSSFLKFMSRVIGTRAQALTSELDGVEKDLAEDIQEFSERIANTAGKLGEVDETSGAEFAVLWKGMAFDYGPYIEQSRTLGSTSDVTSETFDDLIEAFELFAIGREYFKTLYYAREVSKLSRTLLIVALPSILFNASTLLAIDAGIFPDVWILGLPPLQTFVAVAFTISLAPYLVLTSYILRLSTVARLTAAAGIFTLE